MPPERIDLLRIGLRRARGVPLARTQELHLDIFLGKETLFLGHKPWEVEHGLTEFIGDALHAYRSSGAPGSMSGTAMTDMDMILCTTPDTVRCQAKISARWRAAHLASSLPGPWQSQKRLSS